MFYLIAVIMVDGVLKVRLLDQNPSRNLLIKIYSELLDEKKYKILDIVDEEDFALMKVGIYAPKQL